MWTMKYNRYQSLSPHLCPDSSTKVKLWSCYTSTQELLWFPSISQKKLYHCGLWCKPLLSWPSCRSLPWAASSLFPILYLNSFPWHYSSFFLCQRKYFKAQIRCYSLHRAFLSALLRNSCYICFYNRVVKNMNLESARPGFELCVYCFPVGWPACKLL